METIELLQSVASPALDALALAITNFGHELSYVALLVIAYLVFDPVQGRRLAIYVLIGFYLNGLLKGAFDTPRPYQLDPDLLRSQAAGETAPGPGFPSGHAQGAITFWGIAALYLRRRWFTAIAVAIVALVSLSRLYLGVHLPVDVIGGLVAGGLLVAAVPLLDGLQPKLSYGWLALLGVALPLALHLLIPSPDSALILGGLAGFLTAPLILPYRAPASLRSRALTGAIGLLLVFAGLFGSSAVLPEEIKRSALGGFLRYQALAYVALVLAPLLARAVAGGRKAGMTSARR